MNSTNELPIGWFEYQDFTKVALDENLLAEIKGFSQTQIKKLFVPENEKINDAVYSRTLFEAVASKDIWQKEKKNKGSKITKQMEVWAKQFGREDVLS